MAKRTTQRRRQRSVSSDSESDHVQNAPVAVAAAAISLDRLEDDQDALAAAIQELGGDRRR